MNDKQLKRKRTDLERRVKELEQGQRSSLNKPNNKSVHPSTDKKPNGCMSFWFWIKTFILVGVGSWSVLVLIAAIVAIISLIVLLGSSCALVGVWAELTKMLSSL